MPLHGELAISALQFNVRDRAGYPKHFVIVAFRVCGQNEKPFRIEIKIA
jgi:hypothetical protein